MHISTFLVPINPALIDKCRICGTEGETIEHMISSCTVLAQSEYKKRHDIFAKIIHMNLAVKFNLIIHNHLIFINQRFVWKMTITNYILIVQF
jgi:trehalose-6-phosphatase